jgi:1,4-alpha-glucan branching enzyme
MSTQDTNHRWVEGSGQDMVVVASLREETFYDYKLGLPLGGWWRKAFNTDIYQNWVNPLTAGNGGGVQANAGGLHGFNFSAGIVIPANAVVVLAAD